MYPRPAPQLTPNTLAYESFPMVKATGFREYDARWLFGKEINLMGIQALGLGLGTLLREMGELEDCHAVVDPAQLPDTVTGEMSDRDRRLPLAAPGRAHRTAGAVAR